MGLMRGAGPTLLAALSQPSFYPAALVWIDWPVDPFRAHSGVGTLTWDGVDWSGVGKLSAAWMCRKKVRPWCRAARRSPSWVCRRTCSTCWTAPIRNRMGRIWSGAVTTRGGTSLIGEPVETFAGYMDASRLTVEVDEDTIMHGIQIELGTGPGARELASINHSAEDQARAYPGDTAGRHCIYNRARVETMQWPEP